MYEKNFMIKLCETIHHTKTVLMMKHLTVQLDCKSVLHVHTAGLRYPSDC